MDYLVECYDGKGAKIWSVYAETPMAALELVSGKAQWDDGFEFVTATCYLRGAPQWELEIK